MSAALRFKPFQLRGYRNTVPAGDLRRDAASAAQRMSHIQTRLSRGGKCQPYKSDTHTPETTLRAIVCPCEVPFLVGAVPAA
jgi:hypothetical protein